jgi:AcrR family transcriptional regulator
MPCPKFQRRKDHRPAEITEAALAVFAENGYSATRVDDVARRAGVSKGLLYLYFKTKEELFKAVIRSFVAPKVQELSAIVDESDLSAEEFVRGPFLEMIKTLPDSPLRIVVRLMFAEGHKHPDLVEFYWENVVVHALEMMNKLIARGVADGEFRNTAVNELPQLLVSPVIFSIFWNQVFDKHATLNTDLLIETHIDAMLLYLKVTPSRGGAE